MSKRKINLYQVVTISLFSNGTIVSSTMEISQILVNQSLNEVPSAQITLLEGRPSGGFELSNGDHFIPGKSIEIYAGYQNDEIKIFEGIVIKHRLEIQKEGARLLLEVKDPSIQMTVGRKNNSFFESTDADIAETLIQNYPLLSSDIESSGPIHPEMIQYFSTDWDFILSRAQANGKFIRVINGQFKIFRPDLNQDPRMELNAKRNILQFSGEIDSSFQFQNSTSASWDYSNQQIQQEHAEDPNIEDQGNISSEQLASVIGLEENKLQHGGTRMKEELQAWANSDLLQSRLSKIYGEVQTFGNGEILPGDLVSLVNFGDRFDGIAFVTSVKHELNSQNGWLTTLKFGLDPNAFSKQDNVESDPATSLIPGIKGLQIGKITALERDPAEEFRVKVEFPIMGEASEGIWARLANLDAGPGRGVYFIPEIGDEVIVGFVNEDPRDAVILGSLFSNAHPAPLSPADDNPQKGIFTRSGLKIVFDDDSISIKIETPKGKTLQISEEDEAITIRDENGNHFQMSNQGIDLFSSNRLSLKAAGDIEIEGVNVDITAQAQLKAEGSASASLQSSGTTEVKGSIVQIN